MTLIVRDIAPEDQDVWRTLFRAYGVFYETDITDEILAHVWSAIRGDAIRALVAVRSGGQQDGAVVGFAHVRTYTATFAVGEDWHLEDLYVDPSARAGGVATAIIEHIVKIARREGGGILRWVTSESNATARRVYDKLATLKDWVTYEIDLGES